MESPELVGRVSVCLSTEDIEMRPRAKTRVPPARARRCLARAADRAPHAGHCTQNMIILTRSAI